MLSNPNLLVCQYRYDSLDRLVDCALSGQVNTKRFYVKTRLSTELKGTADRSIMQHGHQLLAERHRQSGSAETHLLATDQQRSLLHVLNRLQHHPMAYTAFGHRPQGSGLLSLLGFNGEQSDPVTGHYLLGNGYRAFNPVLMRFNSPDSWSPFREGGLNAYAYCAGDPVNFSDPTGHFLAELVPLAKELMNFMGDTIKTTRQAVTRGHHPAESISIERQYLKTAAAADADPSPYTWSVNKVNENLASHNNNALTMPQAKHLESIIQQVNGGKISNTTAHLREAESWAHSFSKAPNGNNLAGAVLNTVAAVVRGADDHITRVTGHALRRGSIAPTK